MGWSLYSVETGWIQGEVLSVRALRQLKTSLWDYIAGSGVMRHFRAWRDRRFRLQGGADPVRVYDLHATLLHALGLNHLKLTHPHEGRDDSLTDAVVSEAKVIKQLLA